MELLTMIQEYIEAPLEYRGFAIHLDDLEGCFTVVKTGRLWAADWPALRSKIDTHLDY
jgi:hypothetical protein